MLQVNFSPWLCFCKNVYIASITLNIEESNVHFVYDIVEKFAIDEDELSHIFVNGKYCGIEKEVRDGDRVGLFPKNMALMFAEICDKSRC